MIAQLIVGMLAAWAIGIITGSALKGLIDERKQEGDTTR